MTQSLAWMPMHLSRERRLSVLRINQIKLLENLHRLQVAL